MVFVEEVQMPKTYYLSQWCKPFVRNDVMALLHSLSLGLVFLPREAGESFLELMKTGVSKDDLVSGFGREALSMVDERLLVSSPDEDIAYLRETRESLLRDLHLDLAYLLLADGCNLQCRYCFEETPAASSFRASRMSEETVVKALECFARLTSLYGRSGSKKVIHLYGGEPLLNPKAVYAAVLKVAEMKDSGVLPSQTDVVIVTNGTLMTCDLAEFFARYGVTVGISLDGPKRINDVHRIGKGKRSDVFERAKQAYELAKERGVTVGLSATLTPEVVQNFDEVLSYFIDDLGIQDGISFNILHFNPAMDTDGDYFDLAARCLLKAFERFRDLGIYEERMMRKAQAFVDRAPIFTDCGVNGSQIVVAPDGSVGVCQDFVKPRTYFQGTVFAEDYDPFASGLFDGWQKRSPFFMEECLGCEAVGICGGGCPASVELKSGSRWNIDERICPHSRLSLEWLIWKTYAEAVAA
jgi:uncharacterized protein